MRPRAGGSEQTGNGFEKSDKFAGAAGDSFHHHVAGVRKLGSIRGNLWVSSAGQLRRRWGYVLDEPGKVPDL
jgi:hypothetical protein